MRPVELLLTTQIPDQTIRDILHIRGTCLHARPAGLLVKEAKKFQSATTLAAKGKTAAAGKLIAIMSMGVKQGDEVTVQVEGPDEDAAFEALEKFFQENL